MTAVVVGLKSRQNVPAANDSGWNWELLVPHNKNGGDSQPLPRDPWNALLAYEDALYLFGGVYPKYGPSQSPGDLSTMGSLNDLWRFGIRDGSWTLLQPDNGSALFDESDVRPCGRVLPGWAEVGGKFYLFGGLTAFGAGWKTRLLNDLWQYDPVDNRWTLLEPDDGRQLRSRDQVDADRPTALAAMGTAVVGQRIYLFAGWGGQQPSVVLSNQLWSYDVVRSRWEFHGSQGSSKEWPAKRYCPAVTSWQERLFLWAGRDTESLDPQWYNDLWSYDPETARWEQLAENGPGGTDDSSSRPAARYGMGAARIGADWYIMGGFGNETGNAPQWNDLWRLDLRGGDWTLLQPSDRSKDVSPKAARPCVRRVPGMTASSGAVYLFGGLDLTSGPHDDGPILGFNDLWRGSPR